MTVRKRSEKNVEFFCKKSGLPEIRLQKRISYDTVEAKSADIHEIGSRKRNVATSLKERKKKKKLT